MKPASKLKRLIALVIDCILASVLGFTPYVGLVLSLAYLLMKDGMRISGLKGRSIGKLAMNLRVADTTGVTEKQTPLDSIKRNVLFLVPFMGLIEGIVVLVDAKGQRIGDRIAQTQVVEG